MDPIDNKNDLDTKPQSQSQPEDCGGEDNITLHVQDQGGSHPVSFKIKRPT